MNSLNNDYSGEKTQGKIYPYCSACDNTGAKIVKIKVTYPHNYGLLDYAFQCDYPLGPILRPTYAKYGFTPKSERRAYAEN